MPVQDVLREVLVPLVGKPATEICVSSAAIRLGKQAAGMTVGDLPAVEETIRSSLGAFTSRALLDEAIEEIERRLA